MDEIVFVFAGAYAGCVRSRIEANLLEHLGITMVASERDHGKQ